MEFDGGHGTGTADDRTGSPDAVIGMAVDRQARADQVLLRDLRHAIHFGALELHYQPQVGADGAVIGFEALARWPHPSRGTIGPDVFIPLAEQHGGIQALTEWTLSEACREAASWHFPLTVSVNISPEEFRNGDLAALVHTTLLRTGLAAARLEVEITDMRPFAASHLLAIEARVVRSHVDEHIIVERNDGSLWLLARTKYGIGESVSTDRGQTWTEVKPSGIAHPSARFFISRLHSGNLLLVKHGPIDKPTGRSHLMAFVSRDEGQTWQGGLLLDERAGVSYPDGQQAADGQIHIIYDFSRTVSRHILRATFREEDVLAGKPVSKDLQLRQLISEASGGQEKPKPVIQPVEPNADGVPLQRENPGSIEGAGFRRETFRAGATLFTDRGYVVAEVPEALHGALFLQIPLEGEKTVRCAQAGTVWFLTPTRNRNRDTQTETLTSQGFRKVAIPEVRLFNPEATGNYCTLYQKECGADEEIRVGKWAVPLWLPRN